MGDKIRVELEVLDPTDNTTQVFAGPDELSVQRQADEFFGVDEANRRELDA